MPRRPGQGPLAIRDRRHRQARLGEACELVGALRQAMASGSALVVTHGTREAMTPDIAARVERLYAGSTNPVASRSHAQVVRFFDGFDVLPPGVVILPRWHLESADDLFADRRERSSAYGRPQVRRVRRPPSSRRPRPRRATTARQTGPSADGRANARGGARLAPPA